MKIIDEKFMDAMRIVANKINVDIKPFCEHNFNYRPDGSEGSWLFAKRKLVNFLRESIESDYFIHTGKYEDSLAAAKEWAASQKINTLYLIDKQDSEENYKNFRVR